MANFVRKTMVVLVGALALWVAVPAVAGAASPSWAFNGSPLTKSVATTWSGKITITDGGPGAGPQSVECAEKGEGSAGTGGAGEITKLTLSECATIKTCQKSEITAEPVNLPWHTELVSIEGTLHDKLVSGGSGTPGINVKCKVLGIKIEDKCSGTLGTTTSNTSEGVTAAFSASEKLNCAIGGSNSGYVEGSQKIVAAGGVLSAEAVPPSWLVAGLPAKGERAAAIEWKTGKMLVFVAAGLGDFGVRCEDSSGLGTVGENGTGTVTSFTLTNCDAGEDCRWSGPASITALHLPWKTQLAFGSKESVHLSFAEDGAGAPGFKVSCEYNGSPVSYTCGEQALPAGPLTNVAGGGVLAEMDGEGVECGGAYGASFRETSETLVDRNGEALSVS